MSCTHLPIVVTVAALTHVGRQRALNQDSLVCCPLPQAEPIERGELTLGDGALLLSVCDGMGGGQGGEVASGLSTTALRRSLATMEAPYTTDAVGRALVAALEGANDVIRSTARSLGLRDMGTTATAAVVVGQHVLLGQIGDSRAYLLREGRLARLTRDQSLAQQMIESGLLRPEDLATFEHGNIILQALGTAPTILVDVTWATLRRGDVLLLCSDGLWGSVDEGRIATLLGGPPDVACQRLVDAANEAGGPDNISCVVCRVDGPALPLPVPGEPAPGYQKLMFQDEPLSEPPAPDSATAGVAAATAPLAPAAPPVVEDPPVIPLRRTELFAPAALLLAGVAALGLGLLRCL